MKCPNCGKNLAPDVKFCSKCGTPLPEATGNTVKKQTWKTVIGTIAILVVGMVLGILATKFIEVDFNEKPAQLQEETTGEWKEDTEEPVKDEDTESAAKDVKDKDTESAAKDVKDKDTESAAKDAKDKDTKTPVKDKVDEDKKRQDQNESEDELQDPVFDTEAYIKYVREQYNEMEKNKNKGVYTKNQFRPGIVVYYDDTYIPRIITFESGTEYCYYYREYYFDKTGDLIFSYFEEEDAHRLYFFKDELVRWRYSPDALKAQDAINMERNEEYYVWENNAKSEAYDYYIEFMGF